jgi:CheY-like chemotaxis protein
MLALRKPEKVKKLLPGENAAPRSLVHAAIVLDARRLRILVIDDEPLIRKALSLVLAAHEVTTASNGREALDHIAHRPFDLVLCDLMMPIMSGMELRAEVRAHHPGLLPRMVFMSGHLSPVEAHAMTISGGNLILEKPVGQETILELVAKTTRRDD